MSDRQVRSMLIAFTVLAVAVSLGCNLDDEKPSEPKAEGTYAACRAAIGEWDLPKLERELAACPANAQHVEKGKHTLFHYVARNSTNERDDPHTGGQMVRALVNAGADVNAYNSIGYSPLMEIARTYPCKSSLSVAEALLACGADPRARNRRFSGTEKDPIVHYGYTVIDHAARRGFAPLVEKLLELNVPIEYPETRRIPGEPPVKDSALHCACENWVDTESDAEEKEDNENFVRTIDLLCAKISDVNVRNFQFQTPLMVATDWGNSVIVDHLLTNYPAVDINAEGPHGYTALHFAVDGKSAPERSAELIAILLKHGASQDVINNQGETPLELARKKHGLKLVKCFQGQPVK